MVEINKEEAMAIRERFPNAGITRTMKQKSKRHKYYCEESRKVMQFLNRLREPEKYAKGRGEAGHKKTKK